MAPRTSEERLASVFPRGRLSPEALKYRLTNTPESLTYQTIFNGFVAVMDDLEASKAYIEANIDLVPSKLFLRYVHHHHSPRLDITFIINSIHHLLSAVKYHLNTDLTHSHNTPFHLLHPINTTYQHNIFTHPMIHLLNPPSLNPPCQRSALTAQKLSAQSKNDLPLMEKIKTVRQRYIVAHDQMFFPLNIEVGRYPNA